MRFTLFDDSNLIDLHSCFEKCFSDYAVPFKLSFDSFRRRVYEKIHINSKYSVLIWEEGKLIGFILHSTGLYNNQQCIYNGGTGILQEHRGKGLVKSAYGWIIPKLKTDGFSSIVLEVIQNNHAALKLYTSLGFQQTQSFHCFKILGQFPNVSHELNVMVNDSWNLKRYVTLQRYAPSFIDTSENLMHNAENELIVEAHFNESLVGYAIFQPRLGRISQIGWADCDKSQEIVTSLLKTIENRTFDGVPITIMNIKSSNEKLIQFLRNIGFESQVKQFEMVLALTQ